MKTIKILSVVLFTFAFTMSHGQTKYTFSKSKINNLVEKAHNDHSYTSLLAKMELSPEHQIGFTYVMCVIASQSIQDQRNIASGVAAYLRNQKLFSKAEFDLLNSYLQKDKNSSKSMLKLKGMKKYSTPQAGSILGAFASISSNETSYGLVDSGVEFVSIVVGAGAGGIAGGIGGGASGGVAGAGVGSVVPGLGTGAGAVIGGIGGAITGAITGAGVGAGIGAGAGDKLGDLIEAGVDYATSSDSTSTSADKDVDSNKDDSSFMLGPNGEDCLPPFFQF